MKKNNEQWLPFTGARGTGISLFGLGYRTPTSQDEKVKNLLSSAVNRVDLWILNYNKTVFGRALPRTPLGELTTLSQTAESDGEGTSPPHYHPSLVSGSKGSSDKRPTLVQKSPRGEFCARIGLLSLLSSFTF